MLLIRDILIFILAIFIVWVIAGGPERPVENEKLFGTAQFGI